jgi:hypothetical protein
MIAKAPAPKPARLYALIARKARKAAVFRRGPSKSVLLLAWDLKDDALTPGQWLKGRIYERRCDLSPDGALLVYFAANQRPPLYSWTAVSRPPYLTALALWPKGDRWGGGGLFKDERTLSLNHSSSEMRLGNGFRTPAGFAVEPLGDHSGRGEDEPIGAIRLERDGWTITTMGEASEYRHDRPLKWEIDPPTVFEKPLGKRALVLRTNLLGVGERDGTWYVQTSQIVGPDGVLRDLGRIDWSDVDHNGDVLFAKSGCLFRLSHWALRPGEAREGVTLVADLNGLSFERVPPHALARSWPKSTRSG